MDEKECIKCKAIKSINEFYLNRRGHRSNCKECHCSKMQAYAVTEAGKSAAKRYKLSEKGKASSKRRNARYKAKLKEVE